MADTVFSNGTIYAKSELSMINECLLTIGEAPLIDDTIVDLIPVGTDGDIARRVIQGVMLDVQSRGWYFNTDYDMELLADSDGIISTPPNVLKLDFGNTGYKHKYTLKNGKVYDMEEKTYYIGKDLAADVVWLIDYADLPYEAYEYISSRASRKFQQRVIGAQETDQYAARDEQDSYVQLQRVQMQMQDYNIQNSRVSTRIHNGYLVASLYGNKTRR